MVQLYACCHIEVCAQPGILLKPVFIIGLYPVYLSVFEREICNGTEDFCVIFQIVNLVIFREAAAKGRIKRLVRSVGYTQYVDTTASEVLAEMPVCTGEMGGYKNEIHTHLQFNIRLYSYKLTKNHGILRKFAPQRMTK